MSLFNSEIFFKEKILSHYSWGNRKMPDKERIKFTVVGNRVTKEFIYCMYLVKGLHKYRQKHFQAPVIRDVTGVEWPKVWNDLKIQFGSIVHSIKSQVAVFIDDQFLGEENELRELVQSQFNYRLNLDYRKEGIAQFTKYVKSCGRPCAYMQICVDSKPIGTLIFMLYDDIVPHTCQNFLKMCEATKGGYGGTPIHRIVKDCWIQGGGYGLKSPVKLCCENFIIPHDRRGVLCMANDGRHNDSSTQFFVLLQPAHWMKHKYVAFGQLIEGEETLKKIESIPTWYESPMSEIRIYKAAIFNVDSNKMPIHKGTHEYIDGHIENLNTIGEIFYEIILQRVFVATNKKKTPLKILKPIAEDDIKNVRPAKRFMIKTEEKANTLTAETENDSDTLIRSRDVESDEFDVEEYEYEFEEETFIKQHDIETLPGITKPKKPFFIPLTDVPYPGEVDSNFDLKKLLRGDYCLESDLEKNNTIRKQGNNAQRNFLPEDVLKTLFENAENLDDVHEYYLNQDDENEIKEYIKENTDTLCFAGPVVNKMASGLNKFEILNGVKVKNIQTDLLSDGELRLIRMALKKYRPLQSSTPPEEDSESGQSRSLSYMNKELTDSYFGYNKFTSKVFRYPLKSANITRDTPIRKKPHSSKLILDQKLSKTRDDFATGCTVKHVRSLRAIEFAKIRPLMTIIQYRLKNQKYEEQLKMRQSMNTYNNFMNTDN